MAKDRGPGRQPVGRDLASTAEATTVTATAGHPFWVPSLREWVDAGELKPGQWLQTSSGAWIQIGAVEAWTAKKATVHNLTVTDVHTYYVLVGAAPVLAHNCIDPRPDFNSDLSANGHYSKHVKGVDFRIKKGRVREPQAWDASLPEFDRLGGRKAYREAARDFMHGDGPDGSITVRTPSGAVHRFDPSTGYYGYLNSGGTISTFFRPAEGLSYFRRSAMSAR
ncbi:MULTISPECIES: polymorphic toxin-type HINT domain-containing protein [Streptomyces]|uniref:Polymorphic toxin-type HINT domain-containing protein n=1 Tax=Streptomyces sp. 900129855 TaxID=3155129 RepID=A0ABV2ZIW2_9ACTN